MRYFIIPIFVPHLGCPHQCIFCNQRNITGVSDPATTPNLLEETVSLYLETWGKKDGFKTQIAFYGGSFTGLDLELQKSLLSRAHNFISRGEVSSIRISTRPDYIDSEIVSLLEDYGVDTVELGVQSMADRVLTLSGRGHTSADVEMAVETIKGYDLELGLQIMPGLPGDTPDLIMNTVDKIIKIGPDFVRIYPTLVIKDTPLEKLYLRGGFLPMTLDEAVSICKNALVKFKIADIPVIRLGLQSTPELERQGTIIAGPYHPSFRHLVESAIFFDMAERLIEKSPLYDERLTFRVTSEDYSYFCGQKNGNIAKLKERYKKKDIKVIREMDVKKGTLELVTDSSTFCIDHRKLIN
ncbi:MAG: radical SAM protein [Deltaproteobacteria bacterium]|jgi:histone acetyltransferase (RNA polymerase elongator complex component)|nr:MAG: radical SAM protein [Deltaproteobacteria bacterium]